MAAPIRRALSLNVFLLRSSDEILAHFWDFIQRMREAFTLREVGALLAVGQKASSTEGHVKMSDADIHPEPNWESLQRFTFGDNPSLADELLHLVLQGIKTATCWSVEDGQLTEVGRRSVVCDSQDIPRAILETVCLERQAFDQVSEDFARREGEGDLSLDYWRRSHRIYFERTGGFRPDMMLWCETFRLVAIIDPFELSKTGD